MIVGSLSCWEQQSKFEHPVIASAIEELKKIVKEQPAKGRIEIRGDQMYVLIMELDAKPIEEQPLAEKHESYLDLHFLIEGEETIGWSPLQEDEIPVKPYDSELDFAMYEPSTNEMLLSLKPGMFVVLFPNDLHRPCIGESTRIKKAVVKIHVDLLNNSSR